MTLPRNIADLKRQLASAQLDGAVAGFILGVAAAYQYWGK